MRPEEVVSIRPDLISHYAPNGVVDRMYPTGFFDVDIGRGKYVGNNLNESEVKDFISYFVSDETYRKIFGNEE